MTTKTKKVKARKFWGYPAQVKQGQAYITTKQAGVNQDVRLWLIPATPAAYDAMVERMARAMFEMRPGWSLKNMPPAFVEAWGNQARAALAAIGIKEPKA